MSWLTPGSAGRRICRVQVNNHISLEIYWALGSYWKPMLDVCSLLKKCLKLAEVLVCM